MKLAVEKFDAEMIPQDHAEAVLIDRHFDEIGANNPKQAVKAKNQAIEIVDNELSDPTGTAIRANPELFVRGAEIFGYQTAKEATRWWKYREKYVEDLARFYKKHPKNAPFDLYSAKPKVDPHHKTQSKQLKSIRKEHALAGDKLYNHDPATVALYSTLERIRRQYSGTEDFLGEALLEERNIAISALLIALDKRFSDPRTVQLGKIGLFTASFDANDSGIAGISATRELKKKIAKFRLWITEREADESTEVTPFIFSMHRKGNIQATEERGEDKKPVDLSTSQALVIIGGISKEPFKIFKKVAKSI